MKLNIYNKDKTIVKTYEADEYKLMYGTLEDLLDAIDIDTLNTGSNVEIAQVIANFINESRDTAKDLLKDMFDGLTDDELRRAAVDEMLVCLSDAVKYVFKQVKRVVKRKN